jgi:hypothetical protein
MTILETPRNVWNVILIFLGFGWLLLFMLWQLFKRYVLRFKSWPAEPAWK